MTLRIDSSEYFDGLVIGDTGLGVLAENIPSSGDSGPSFLYNDLSFPSDNGKEIRGEILTQPSDGTLFVYEDGSFEFSNAPDGNYSFTYQLYVDGNPIGSPSTVFLAVGVENGSATATPSSVVLSTISATANGTDNTTNGLALGNIASINIQIPSAFGNGTDSSTNGLGTSSALPIISLSLVSATAIGENNTNNGIGSASLPSLSLVVMEANATGTTGIANGSGSGSLASLVILPPSAVGRVDGVIFDSEIRDVVIFNNNKINKVTADIRIKKVSL